MELTIRTGGADGAERLPALVRLRNWLIGPPEGTRLPPKQESDEDAEKRRQLDSLSPAGLALQIANVMWAQRGSLKIEASSDSYESRGLHSMQSRSFSVEIPGGITMSFDEKCERFQVTSPDGESETFTRSEATRISMVWRAIQAVSMCDAMGVSVPSENGGMRPSAALKALDAAICSIVERGDPPCADATYEYRCMYREMKDPSWETCGSGWKDLGCGIFLDPNQHCDRSYHRDTTDPVWYRVMSADMGVLRLRREAMNEALERRKRSSFANALGLARALPAHLPMPSGNAQAARILRLCREAVAREPDLVDAKGTRIAPLVEQHLPRLMQKHAEAARIAEASELAAIDAELMQGIELVRQALEEALTVSRVDKREALRTELAFLEYRHPAPNLLSIEASKDPA